MEAETGKCNFPGKNGLLKEFAQLIGKEVVPAHGYRVEYAPRAESGPIFDFYMGKNTPERKDYIMDKLVVPVSRPRPQA